MQMREDPDLEFMAECKSKELDPLVRVLTHGKDGTPRLTGGLDLTEEYKAHHPKHRKYWRLVAAELQYYGADSAMTVLRGNKGVPYREILTDVCKRLKVNYKDDSPVEVIETNLLMKMGMDIFEQMTPEEMGEIADEIGVKRPSGVSGWTATVLVQIILKQGAFATYKWALIIANAIANAIAGAIATGGLPFVANTILVRTLHGLIGPVGWGLTALWAASIVTGPAYRVTIPAVLQVIALRRLVDERL